MLIVAKRRFTRCFAATKINLVILLSFIKHRLEAVTFVLTVAKELIFSLAATAPEVTLACFHFSFMRRSLRTLGLAQNVLTR